VNTPMGMQLGSSEGPVVLLLLKTNQTRIICMGVNRLSTLSLYYLL